jgi:serine/threonine-protein kinase
MHSDFSISTAERTDIPGYRIVRHLGKGAGSQIWEALRLKDNERFALKRVACSEAEQQRFVDQAINEHRVGARLDHPNLRRTFQLRRRRSLLRVMEFVLVMELVAGQTLEDARPPTLWLLLKAFNRSSRGLAAMHAAGWVHADIKPRNILCSPDGAVKVIDYGQACRLHTQKERLQGTPHFIAPEQVRKDKLVVQTDVFNLGASLYWCILGKHAPSLITQDVSGHLWESPTMPSLTHPREVNPEIPVALNQLIVDCLNVQPSNRPPTMGQFEARITLAMSEVDRDMPVQVHMAR